MQVQLHGPLGDPEALGDLRVARALGHGADVTVSDGAGGSCTLTLSGAAGACTLASTSAGAKTLTATYAGDSNFYGSVSAGAPHTVNKAPTTTITNVSPEPSMLAQPYTVYFSVTVNSPGAGTSTGTVTVSDGTGNSCSATLAAGNCALPSTTAGQETLTASYSGDSNFMASSGNEGAQHRLRFHRLPAARRQPAGDQHRQPGADLSRQVAAQGLQR